MELPGFRGCGSEDFVLQLHVERNAQFVGTGIHFGPILALSVLNSLFEVLFVCGYLSTALQAKKGFWFAVNASAGLRLIYHLYQGPWAVISILPIGLAFAIWFAQTRQLWPLVVAHALFDLLGLFFARQ